ncbi:MAG: type IV pilin protein [Candidatus Zixiibacteriota bacterium]
MKKILIIIFVILALIIIFRACNQSTEDAKKQVQEAAGDYVDTPTIRARQSEAKILLKNLYQKQQDFYSKQGHYTMAVDSLQGFRQDKLKAGEYYELSITNATSTSFKARARGNVDGDETYDVWEIDESGKLEHVYNDEEF